MANSPDADQGAGTDPEQQAAEHSDQSGQGAGEGVTIPKGRLDKAVAQRNAAQAQVEKLQGELEMLREQVKAPREDAAVELDSGGKISMDKLAEMAAEAASAAVEGRLGDYSDRQKAVRDARHHGLTDVQADAVVDLQREKELSFDEAKALLEIRQPDLFKGQDPRAYTPEVHGTMPSGGSSSLRAGEEPVDHMKEIREAPSAQLREPLVRKELGRRLERFFRNQ